METKKNRKSPNSGRKPHQKLKAYLIYEYLLKYSDEDHTYSANDQKNILELHYSITAERGRYIGTFINTLLDTALEKFGTKNVVYSKVDDSHFKVTADVEVSEQFYGWVLGFGKRAKILFPYDVADEFREYLDKVKSIYEDE